MNPYSPKNCLIGIFIFLCIIGSPFISSGEGINVDIIPDKELKQTSYIALASDQQKVSLVSFQTDINKGVLRFRSSSNAPYIEQLEILKDLLHSVLKLEPENPPHTLFIGGMEGAFGEKNSILSERISLAAYRSELWNYQKGRPVSGHENPFLIKLSNQESIFKELNHAIFSIGLWAEVSGIEKVFIFRADKLPFFNVLQEKGVTPEAKLPSDGLTWLALKSLVHQVHVGGGYWKNQKEVVWRWPEKKQPPKDKSVKIIEKKLSGADPRTFIFLFDQAEGAWGRDKNHLFFFHEKMDGVDMDSWQPMDMGYSKDKHAVYDGAVKIEDADPDTFKIPLGE